LCSNCAQGRQMSLWLKDPHSLSKFRRKKFVFLLINQIRLD
jgi:hypothetical protein